MAITPAMIRELREISGAGMTDCKKALDQSEGDIQKAVVILREKGLASAAKKAGRIAAEGIVSAVISEDGKTGVVIEVNCETDFVAKNPEFKGFVTQLTDTVFATGANTVEELLAKDWEYSDAANVGEAVSGKIALFGENVGVRRFEKIVAGEGKFLQKYVHGEGRIAVLVEVESDVVNEAMLEAAKNVCMQITVMRPLYIAKDNIDEAFLAQEKEILTQQALNEGKDAKVVEKMIVGRLQKRLKEICLLDQAFVRDNDVTVEQYIASVNKENNATAKVTNFAVYEKGEGIAKKEENFAEEVSKAMQV